MAGPHAAHVRALETLLARIRQRKAALLDLDMWDRWGRQHASPEEIAERAEHERISSADLTAATRELTALVEELRSSTPEAIAAWASAHEAFLQAFLADPARDSTAVFVANEERAGWAAVQRGERAFVDENCFYITIDRDRYRALFGIDP